MVKKIFVLGLALIMCMGIFAGCGNKNQYNATIFYNASALMKGEYLEVNMTWDVSIQGEQPLGADLPPSRTHIITDKTDFSLAFAEFPEEIDFSEKMILVHFFTSLYPTKPYKLEKVKLDGDTLHIDFKLNKSGSPSVPDASKPQQTCIVILMDKLDIEAAVFKQK